MSHLNLEELQISLTARKVNQHLDDIIRQAITAKFGNQWAIEEAKEKGLAMIVGNRTTIYWDSIPVVEFDNEPTYTHATEGHSHTLHVTFNPTFL